ncbi:MAG TPA: Coenzyme F420 hydrogenase/dehydrogenase, beta subunit C-terminal domain [Paracoccaceae bacterium]|jgi:coenzyme F420 hydrogenase subunit beta
MQQSSSPVLNKVLKGGLCSGCGACAALAQGAVAMRISEQGFLRPVQSGPLSQQQEHRIALTCPGVGLRQQPDGRSDHPLWGPFIGMYSGHATDPGLRRTASSGGGLSALLVYLLETGAVDHVLQVAADPDLPIGNRTVLSSHRNSILAAAGSRYAPSAPLAGLEPYLASGHQYAFVGKPCDVAALQAMKRFDDRVAQRFPYLLSFFCAGVPSLAGAREVLAGLGVAEADVAQFRYRGDGWPGFATATLADGSQKQMSYADSWGGILSRHVQFRCKICPDGTGGFADVVCADAWEADENGYPVFTERDGVSLIVGRTEKGEALIRAAAADGRLEITRFAAAGLAAIQPGQTGKRRYTLSRLLALRVLGRPAPSYRGFHLLRNAAAAGLWANVRNFLGTARRIVLGRP